MTDNHSFSRPNEIIIYESTRYNGRLFERKRMKGRFVHGAARDEVVLSLDMADFRRIGGRRDRERADTVRRPQDASSGAGLDPMYVSPRHERRMARRLHLDRQRRDRDLRRTRESRTEVSDTPPTPRKLRVHVDIPQKLAILLESPPVPTTESLEHSWSATDKSFNIVLKEDDQMIMRRHPIAQSTDCVRGKQGYSSGLHMWEVQFLDQQITSRTQLYFSS